MFGKHFSSTYTGSMMGSGAMIFAVWGYVIAHLKLDRKIGAQVELNPKLMAVLIGEAESDIEGAIRFLCAADSKSRSKGKGGRRLVKIGEYDYQVVNGKKYHDIRNQEDRRIQNREAKRRERSKSKPDTNGSPAMDDQSVQSAVTEGYPKGTTALCSVCGHPTLSVSPDETCKNHPKF